MTVPRAASYLVRVVLGLVAWTQKVEVRGWSQVEEALKSGRLVLLATWHGNILSLFLIRQHIQLPLLTGMISRSRDGDFAAEAVRRFGMFPVRGSSSRGGTGAVLAFRKEIRNYRERGQTVAAVHLLDGPRGPRHKTKGGLLTLARQNEALIVPFLTGASPCRHARSWDRHLIPLPFARLKVRFGAPIDPCATEGSGGEAEAAISTETIDERLRQLAEEDLEVAPGPALERR